MGHRLWIHIGLISPECMDSALVGLVARDSAWRDGCNMSNAGRVIDYVSMFASYDFHQCRC